ncbi:hypothetical protein FACS1894186_7840 [Alphaproteobacteria bacterium]|nr:hypothetical protein FACS1894186_7840 [Alphaproteobacteria bacterium]
MARTDGRGADGAGVERFVVRGGGLVATVDGALVGRVMDMRSVALSPAGDWLGVVGFDGRVGADMKALAGGIVANAQGLVGGALVRPYGAVVDMAARTLGYVSSDGRYVDKNGRAVGRVLADGTALGADGRAVGSQAPTGLVVGLNGAFAGLAESGATVSGRPELRVGRGGVVHDGTGLQGRVVAMGAAIDNAGAVLGAAAENGRLARLSDGVEVGFIGFGGLIFDGKGEVVGRIAPTGAVISTEGKIAGFADVAGVFDSAGRVKGELLSDGSVLAGGAYVGQVATGGMVMGQAGRVLGVAGVDGSVQSYAGEGIAPVLRDDGVAMSETLPVGKAVPASPAVYKSCGLAGYTDTAGNIVDAVSRRVGAYSADGDMTDFDGVAVGAVSRAGAVITGACKVVGMAAPNGRAVSFAGTDLGCIDSAGYVNNAMGKAVAAVAPTGAVVALDDERRVLGRALYDGRAVGLDKTPLGCVNIDGTVSDASGRKVGKVFTYRVFPKASAVSPVGTAPRKAGAAAAKRDWRDAAAQADSARSAANDAYRKALMEAQNARRAKMGMSTLAAPEQVLAKVQKTRDWSEHGVAKSLSTDPVDMSRMILQDKPIPAVLLRALDSRFADTPVTAVVERNVYGEDGRNIVIPSGSRVIGTASGAQAEGGVMTKMQIGWSRLIRPDGVEFILSGSSGDAQGRPGVPGYVDQQLLKKYGLPILETVITSAFNYYLLSSNDMVTTYDTGATVTSSKAQAGADARRALTERMQYVFLDLIKEAEKNRSATMVPAGTRIMIYPNTDIWLKTQEDKDQMAEAKREKKDNPFAQQPPVPPTSAPKVMTAPLGSPASLPGARTETSVRVIEVDGKPVGRGSGSGGAAEPPPQDYQQPKNADGEEPLPPIIF